MTSKSIYVDKTHTVNNLVDKNTTANRSNPQNLEYCTYLTLYSGNKLPPFYIGSTSVENINSGYKGSVNSKKFRYIWKSELKENPHLFRSKIISYHKTRKEAFSKEESFHRRLKVITSPLYVNMAYANGFFDSTSTEIRKAISKGNKGIPKSIKHREKISKSRKASELCRIKSIENLPEPQIGELNGMHSSNRDYNSDHEKLRAKRISDKLSSRSKADNISSYSREKSAEEKEKIRKAAKARHIIYVCRLSDRKVLDYRNFFKYMKTITE